MGQGFLPGRSAIRATGVVVGIFRRRDGFVGDLQTRTSAAVCFKHSQAYLGMTPNIMSDQRDPHSDVAVRVFRHMRHSSVDGSTADDFARSCCDLWLMGHI